MYFVTSTLAQAVLVLKNTAPRPPAQPPMQDAWDVS